MKGSKAQWDQTGDGGWNARAKGLEPITHTLQDLKLVIRKAMRCLLKTTVLSHTDYLEPYRACITHDSDANPTLRTAVLRTKLISSIDLDWGMGK